MKPEGRRKRKRRMCRSCGQRPSRFRQPSTGKYVRDDDHDHCSACAGSARDSLEALKLADGEE